MGPDPHPAASPPSGPPRRRLFAIRQFANRRWRLPLLLLSGALIVIISLLSIFHLRPGQREGVWLTPAQEFTLVTGLRPTRENVRQILTTREQGRYASQRLVCAVEFWQHAFRSEPDYAAVLMVCLDRHGDREAARSLIGWALKQRDPRAARRPADSSENSPPPPQ